MKTGHLFSARHLSRVLRDTDNSIRTSLYVSHCERSSAVTVGDVDFIFSTVTTHGLAAYGWEALGTNS